MHRLAFQRKNAYKRIVENPPVLTRFEHEELLNGPKQHHSLSLSLAHIVNQASNSTRSFVYSYTFDQVAIMDAVKQVSS